MLLPLQQVFIEHLLEPGPGLHTEVAHMLAHMVSYSDENEVGENINLTMITLAPSLRAQFCVTFLFQVLEIPVKRLKN